MRVFSSVAAAAVLIAIAAPGAAQTGSMSGMAMPTCPASSPVVWENTKTHVFSTRSQVGFGVAPGRAVCRSVAVRAGYRAATSMTSRSLGAGSSTPGGSSYNVPNADTRARQPGAGSTLNGAMSAPSTNSGSDAAASQPNSSRQSGSNAPLSAPGSGASQMMSPGAANGTPLPQATGNTSIGQPAPNQAPGNSPMPH